MRHIQKSTRARKYLSAPGCYSPGFMGLVLLVTLLFHPGCKLHHPPVSSPSAGLDQLGNRDQLLKAVEDLGEALLYDRDNKKALKSLHALIVEDFKFGKATLFQGNSIEDLLFLKSEQAETMKLLWKRFGSKGKFYSDFSSQIPAEVNYENLKRPVAAAMVQLLGPNGSHSPGNIGHLEGVFLDAVSNDLEGFTGAKDLRVTQSAFNTFITDMAGKTFGADKSNAKGILAPLDMGKAEALSERELGELIPCANKGIWINCYVKSGEEYFVMKSQSISSYKEAREIVEHNANLIDGYPKDLMGHTIFHGDLNAQYLWDVGKIAGLTDNMILEGIAAHYNHHINYFINNAKAYRGIANDYVKIYQETKIDTRSGSKGAGSQQNLFNLEAKRLKDALNARDFLGVDEFEKLRKYLGYMNLLQESMAKVSTSFYNQPKFSLTDAFRVTEKVTFWKNMANLRNSEAAVEYRKVKAVLRSIDPFVHSQTEADDVAQLARGGLSKWAPISKGKDIYTIPNTHVRSLNGPGKNYLISAYVLQEHDDFLAMLANNTETARAMGRNIGGDLSVKWGDDTVLQTYYEKIKEGAVKQHSFDRETLLSEIEKIEKEEIHSWPKLESELFQGSEGQISKTNLSDHMKILNPFFSDIPEKTGDALRQTSPTICRP